MWIGITQAQKDVLLKLSDVARARNSPVGEVACAELGERGLVRKGADGSWYLSRAGWELLLPF
jgi:hypothetical protein